MVLPFTERVKPISSFFSLKQEDCDALESGSLGMLTREGSCLQWLLAHVSHQTCEVLLGASPYDVGGSCAIQR